MNKLRSALSSVLNLMKLYRYRSSIPSKVAAIRQKPKIKVLFVISEISLWKTEDLYCEMLKHPRFEPVLGVTLLTADKPSEAIRKFTRLTEYLTERNYEYEELYGNDIKNNIRPDIIFYQQPYDGLFDSHLFYQNNKEALFCNVYYAFNTIGQKWVAASPYLHHCWQIYYENKVAMDFCESIMPSISRDKARFTGLPFQNSLEKDKSEFTDPWKPQETQKKRIIWAPHHTIPTAANNLLDYSTFLDVADVMVEIAEKYKDQVQIAFKPHPFLLKKLYNLWGKEKADAYYQKWAQMENTQLESGDYHALFKHSDAMIHDCGSFTIEYLYAGNPVMYLSNGRPHTDTLNQFGKAAYDTHVIGSKEDDIKSFIQDVISGKDALKTERAAFLKDYLTIPDTGIATQNIINCILNN